MLVMEARLLLEPLCQLKDFTLCVCVCVCVFNLEGYKLPLPLLSFSVRFLLPMSWALCPQHAPSYEVQPHLRPTAREATKRNLWTHEPKLIFPPSIEKTLCTRHAGKSLTNRVWYFGLFLVIKTTRKTVCY
jgi:hypothetical protein